MLQWLSLYSCFSISGRQVLTSHISGIRESPVVDKLLSSFSVKAAARFSYPEANPEAGIWNLQSCPGQGPYRGWKVRRGRWEEKSDQAVSSPSGRQGFCPLSPFFLRSSSPWDSESGELWGGCWPYSGLVMDRVRGALGWTLALLWLRDG